MAPTQKAFQTGKMVVPVSIPLLTRLMLMAKKEREAVLCRKQASKQAKHERSGHAPTAVI